VAEINPPVEKALFADPEREISFVPMAAVSEKSASIKEPQIRPAGSCRAGFTGFKRNDVLVAKITPCFENGKIAIANIPHAFGFGSTEFHVVRPDAEHLDHRFLLHILRSPEFRAEGQRRMTGSAGQRRVPSSFLSTFAIPLPTLAEQRRIAAILDQADALRAKRREALAELDKLTQSIFIEMFGDPGGNPLGWLEGTLSELIVDKPNNGIFKKNEDYGEGIPVVWVEELFRGNAINLSKSRRLLPTPKEVEQYGLKNGDVLFCRSSLKLAGVGYNNVYLGVDNKALFECHVIRVSPDKSRVVPEFLNYILRIPSQRQKLFKFAKTVTMSTIDQEGLLKVSLPIPPMELQIAFVKRLNAIDRIRATHSEASSELETLFSSLQHRAFRGEL